MSVNNALLVVIVATPSRHGEALNRRIVAGARCFGRFLLFFEGVINVLPDDRADRVNRVMPRCARVTTNVLDQPPAASGRSAASRGWMAWTPSFQIDVCQHSRPWMV